MSLDSILYNQSIRKDSDLPSAIVVEKAGINMPVGRDEK